MAVFSKEIGDLFVENGIDSPGKMKQFSDQINPMYTTTPIIYWISFSKDRIIEEISINPIMNYFTWMFSIQTEYDKWRYLYLTNLSKESIEKIFKLKLFL